MDKKNFKCYVPLVITGDFNPAGMTEPEAVKEAVEHVLAEARSNVEYNGEQNGVTVIGINEIDGPAADLEDLYIAISSKYRDKLISDIKRLLRERFPGGIDVESLYQNGDLERICKYDTPKDEPDNFSLHQFGIDGKGDLFANADSIYDGGGYDFPEDALTVADLREISYMLESIKEGLDSGDFEIGEKGNVTVTEEED